MLLQLSGADAPSTDVRRGARRCRRRTRARPARGGRRRRRCSSARCRRRRRARPQREVERRVRATRAFPRAPTRSSRSRPRRCPDATRTVSSNSTRDRPRGAVEDRAVRGRSCGRAWRAPPRSPARRAPRAARTSTMRFTRGEGSVTACARPPLLALPPPMPIYEYKCPNGHLFEVFHGMTEPGPEVCEVCGAAPLQRVLHPVAVHYKGSGFYSTDYGRKSQEGKDGRAGSAVGVVVVGLVVVERAPGSGLRAAASRRRRPSLSAHAGGPARGLSRRRHCSAWPTTQPGSNGPVGGCGADLPRNIAIVAAVVLARADHRLPPPPRSPPSRQCTELDRRRAELHPAELHQLAGATGRSSSGFASEPPSNGSLTSVPGEVSFDAIASITRLLARAARDVGLARVEQVLADARVDQRALAVHVLLALREPPALPRRAARLRRVRAVEAVREDRLRAR